jgi:tetratricopeptide (TPR) repeat protein
MPKYLILLSFIYFHLYLFADDSLQSLYRTVNKNAKTKDTAQLVESYKYLGDYLSETSDFEKSNLYLQKGLDLAQKANIKREIGILSNLLATNASYDGNRHLALSYYHRALKAFTDTRDLDKVAMILMNMGSEYEFMGNYKYAIAYTLKAIENKERSGVKKNLAYYYQSLGQLFKETNRAKWKFYVEKAYQIAQNSTEERVSTRAAIFNDLGGIAQREKNNKQAYIWYDSLIVLAEANDYQNGLATAYSNRSHVYKSEKKLDKALADMLKAMEIGYKLERNYLKITEHTNAANILIEMNRPAEAKMHASKALALASSLKTYPEEEAAAHLALALIGEKTRNWELAYKHYNAYKEGLDSIRAADVQKNMQQLEVKYQTSEKEKEIVRLDSENKLKNLKLQRIQLLTAAIVVVVLLLGILAFVLYRRKQLKYEKQQAELKQKLLRSQMNPHFMFNTLNAINQYIQTNKGLEASDYLAQYAKLMRQILENSAVEFVSLETEIEFLGNYLDMQQLRFEKSFTYTIEVDKSIDTEQFEIPPMIAQPFIENAIEHGVRGMADGEIRIRFSFDNNTLTLTVSDNGKGFQTTTQNVNHKSFALDITRERLNIAGNNTEKLRIASPDPQTGKGTLVTIDIPFKNYE